VNDLSAFVKSRPQIDIFLNMLYVFLALAVFIALLGTPTRWRCRSSSAPAR
jgi:hypothetical protein